MSGSDSGSSSSGGSDRTDSGMHINDGVAIEGRASQEHTHNDGSTGRDVYGARVTYENGKQTSESRDPSYPKLHE